MSKPPWKLDGHQRVRLGKMTHPVRGFLHGTAAIVSVVGAALITVATSGDVGRRMSLLIFGLSLIGLYTVSALYHSIPWGEVWKRRWQRIDHTMIHVLVAGTFTPIAVIVLDGWLRVATLAVQWLIVIVGAVHNLVLDKPVRAFSIALQTTQGWLALLLLWPLADRLPPPALFLIILGGVLYTAGMVVMVTGRPRLWPQVFSSHEVFHVLVVAASSVHFLAIARYVASYGVA
jgi:hemolysin III